MDSRLVLLSRDRRISLTNRPVRVWGEALRGKGGIVYTWDELRKCRKRRGRIDKAIIEIGPRQQSTAVAFLGMGVNGYTVHNVWICG